MRKLGAAPSRCRALKFFRMKSGAIDATEWVGPWNDLASGFYQVANIITVRAFTSRARGCRPALILMSGIH